MNTTKILHLPICCRLITSLLLLSCSLAAGYAQTSYTVHVEDAETGEPLPLVGVYVSEDNATLTNFDGDFTIKAQPTDIVRMTCIGRASMIFRAGDMPEVVRMKMLTSTLSEVTVKAVEALLLQVAKKMEKTFNRKKKREAQYFYRQTSVFSQNQDIVEAFVRARSAVNLRDLQFLAGRHGLLSQAAWNRSSIEDMNLHHLLELGPMTKDATFWHQLITPLRLEAMDVVQPAVPHGKAPLTSKTNQARRSYKGIEYLQHFYDISVDEMDGEDQHLYRFNLRRRADVEVAQPIMTGVLYVDRATLSPLAFDGQVENLELRFSEGELRSATVVPVTFEVHLDYGYERRFAEVANLSFLARWGEFQTRTLLFNVEGQNRLKLSGKFKDKGRVSESRRDNMLASIAEAGYDSTYWANNEVVKRTAEEQAIAQGAVDKAKARIDSVAAYQASLPPLARLADRLARFGQAIPQEKVYVHMDNTSYFLGDTIWFAAYSRRTNEDRPSRISRVLYCELWNHDGYLVERKLVEMKDGRGHGFFALPDTLYSGYFELRAYTRWQLNWGQTEHYHSWYTEYSFYNKAMAKDFFRDYEKLYSRVFPVYDKPKVDGDFYRDMTFRPLRRYFKNDPKEPELRLSLFPEGGNLVAGLPCRVAFEAATSEGEVREGTLTLRMNKEIVKIQNDKGEEVDFVTTENRGRGTFVFTPVEGKSYEAVFTPYGQSEKAKRPVTVSQDIKAVKAEGVALQVRCDSTTGEWRFDIATSGMAAKTPLGLTVMNEGKLVLFEDLSSLAIDSLHQEGEPDGTLATSRKVNISLRRELEKTAGVYQVTVFDSIGHIFADRLFFVAKPELAEPSIQLVGTKEQYAPFERIDFDVTSAHLIPEQTVSLTVRDAVHADNTFDSGNIMTEMLLASEIKGFVPQPDYFFESDDEEHRRALDLLMLTQGWRRFNWQEMAVKGAWDITHPAEHTQIVTGTVNRYWSLMEERDNIFNDVQTDHERFMTEWTPSLSAQQMSPLFTADGRPEALYPSDFHQGMPVGYSRRNMAWNLNSVYEQRSKIGAISDTWHGIYSMQGNSWEATDYNVLAFRTNNYYQQQQRRMRNLAARRYIEKGTVKKEVRVHAEFVNLADKNDFIVGETQTKNGTFRIDLPRFEGQCVFFLGASDTTKWHRKWEGLHRRKPHTWVQMDNQTEYDLIAGRLGEFPEYYVRLNFPYPRWIKPYTYYQVHNAQLRDTTYLSPRLLTDGTHLMNQLTVRMRHGGLRHVDLSKPAYVMDAYQAQNEAWDAGFYYGYQNTVYNIASVKISDMGMSRRYNRRIYLDGRPASFWYGPLDRLRFNMLTYLDKIYIYTDYSPRREGDERYEQSNQPEVIVDYRRFKDKGQRVVYRDRRYILDGFAFQEDFYHPDYKRNPPVDGQKDYRRTLYWNPELKLDVSGRAHVTLYNNSQNTTIAVNAQGQTATGELLYSR